MNGLLRIFWVVVFLGNACLAAGPAVDLWLVQGDRQTTGFLEKALREEAADAARIEERVGELIKGRTLTELARFRKDSPVAGEVLKFEKDREEIRVADGDVIPGGTFLEIEPTFGPSGLVDLRFRFRRAVPVSRNKIDAAETNGSMTLRSGRWEILCDWGDGERANLLLARFSEVVPLEDPNQRRRSETRFDSEIRWCARADLETFRKSTSATRAKAVAWLLGRSKPLATSGFRVLSGQLSIQKDVLQWIHDENGGWDTSELGWEIVIRNMIGPRGKVLDFQLKGRWHPRDARRPPGKPEFSFDFAATTESGTTLVIEPEPLPVSGEVPVIFVTPTTVTVAEGQEIERSAIRSKLPEGKDLGTVVYPVHPALPRKLAESVGLDPRANAGVISMPSIRDLLEKSGMKFPQGASVVLDVSGSQVLLTHVREGHEHFREILETLGMAWTGEQE